MAGMEAFFDTIGQWLDKAFELSADTIAGTMAWISGPAPDLLDDALASLSDRATDHPGVAIAAVAVFLAAFLITRNLLVLSAVSFFSIAAVAGTEPVTDPLARATFPIGCFLALTTILLALRSNQKRIKRLRQALDASERRLEDLRNSYQAEVRWRMADRSASSSILNMERDRPEEAQNL